jgi:hypothetical protein
MRRSNLQLVVKDCFAHKEHSLAMTYYAFCPVEKKYMRL